LEVDGELGLDELTPQLYQSLRRLEPFGQANREPIFIIRGARMVGPARLLKEKHMKLRVAAGRNGRVFDVLAWRMGENLQALNLLAGAALDLAFRLDENQHPEYGGSQLV